MRGGGSSINRGSGGCSISGGGGSISGSISGGGSSSSRRSRSWARGSKSSTSRNSDGQKHRIPCHVFVHIVSHVTPSEDNAGVECLGPASRSRRTTGTNPQ
jgi:hypothetical protein